VQPQALGFRALLWSDYERHYHYKDESPRTRKVLFLPRLLTNACLHANLLVRAVGVAPGPLQWVLRRLLLSKHSTDVSPFARIGPGLYMPHPFGIVLAPNIEIGRNAVIQHLVTITPAVTENWLPGKGVVLTTQLGDDVTVFPQSLVIGPVVVGDRAIISARSLVTRDVPAEHITSSKGELRPATAEELDGCRMISFDREGPADH
jgi:serine O-acetyltransferase